MKKMIAGLTTAVALSGCVQDAREAQPAPVLAEAAVVPSGPEAIVSPDVKSVYYVESINELYGDVLRDISNRQPMAVAFESIYLYWQAAPEGSRQSTVIGIVNPLVVPANIAGEVKNFVAGIYIDAQNCELGLSAFHDLDAGDPPGKWDLSRPNLRAAVVGMNPNGDGFELTSEALEPISRLVYLPFGVDAQVFAKTDINTFLAKPAHDLTAAVECQAY